jgi:hypothetical protein
VPELLRKVRTTIICFRTSAVKPCVLYSLSIICYMLPLITISWKTPLLVLVLLSSLAAPKERAIGSHVLFVDDDPIVIVPRHQNTRPFLLSPNMHATHLCLSSQVDSFVHVHRLPLTAWRDQLPVLRKQYVDNLPLTLKLHQQDKPRLHGAE